MNSRIPIPLRVAFVFGVLLMLLGISGVLLAPVVVSNAVSSIAAAKTNDVNQWHQIASDNLVTFMVVTSAITASLSFAIVMLLSVVVLRDFR